MVAAEAMPIRIDDIVIQVEAPARVGKEEEVSHRVPSFEGFTDALKRIATSVRSSLEELSPDRAKVEFGVDVSIESGQLSAMIVKGAGAAHLTVTLEWRSN